LCGNCVVWQLDHRDSGELVRRIIPNVGEIEIARHECSPVLLCVCGNSRIIRAAGQDIANIFNIVTETSQQGGCRTRKVRVEQEFHFEGAKG
jgi:hypothetical protein